MLARRAGWATVGMLLGGAALAASAASGGCTSVYDDYYDPLAARGAGASSGCAAECCKAEDCPSRPDPCEARTCDSGKCGWRQVEPGQQSAAQTEGDCKIVVCNGDGTQGTKPAAKGLLCDDDGGSVCDGSGACVKCNESTDCEADAYCDANSCVAKEPNGQSCSADDQCASGVCEQSDGVCCETSCVGPCYSCNVPGAAGACMPVPAGEDPAMDCTAPEVCDGQGACKLQDGQACDLVMQGVDCASGNCVDGVCCNNPCAGTCVACNIGPVGTCVLVPAGMPGKCQVNWVCTGGVGAVCAPPSSKRAFGEVCSADDECYSGACRAGTCKNNIGDACSPEKEIDCVGNLCKDNVCASCGAAPDHYKCAVTSCEGNSCRYVDGETCTKSDDCESQYCYKPNGVIGVCQ